MLLHSGREEAVVATQTYMAELAAVALLSDTICGHDVGAGDRGVLTKVTKTR